MISSAGFTALFNFEQIVWSGIKVQYTMTENNEAILNNSELRKQQLIYTSDELFKKKWNRMM